MDAGITRELVLDVTLDPPVPTGRVQARRITLPPSAASGAHVHNGPVFGCIEQGSVVFQVDGGEPVVLHAGDTFHEPADIRIDRFDATGDGVVFIAFFPVGPGQEPELTFVE